MSDDRIAEILVEQSDVLYKRYLDYKELGNIDLATIYSEKVRTVMLLAACFGVWDKIKPTVDCYKL